MAVLLKQLAPENRDYMGLSDSGFSVFPGCMTSIEIPMVQGKFNLGLEDKKLREKFEKHFEVKFDSPEGIEFLSNYTIHISHDVQAFDPRNNVEHEFQLHVLKANKGFGLVSFSDDDNSDNVVNTYKFVVTDDTQELQTRVTRKEVKMAATSELSNLYNSNTSRLVLIAKFLFPASSAIGNNKALAFDKLDDFIAENNKNCQKFLDVLKLDPEYLDTVVKVKMAIHTGIIRPGQDGVFTLFANGTKLGRNEEEVIQFCLLPSNKDIVGYGTKDDFPYSITAQLKDKL